MNLDFLKSLEIAAPAAKAKAVRTGTPLEGEIRIRKTGKIEFSEEFRTRVNGNWIDMFFAHKWLQYDQTKPNVLFLNITDGEKNRAKADIKAEGTSVFVKDSWNELAEGLGFNPELSYVDLNVVNMEIPVPIALIPKTVQRGEDKGNTTYVQREKVILNPVVLCDIFSSPEEPEVIEDETVTEREEDIEVEEAIEVEFDDNEA